MTDNKFLPYGRQTIEEDDLAAVESVLQSDYLTTGPAVKAFEDRLTSCTGAQEAVVCGNGTDALHLACMAVGLKPGDAAIVPTLTFLATANAVRYCGADVIFADVDPETGLMTAKTFKEALVRADKEGLPVKAVLPVHLAGQTVDLEPLSSVCESHDIKMIADASHALGSRYQGEPVGAGRYEDLSTYSFHPVKTIAMGEGGAVTTNNSAYAEAMRRLRHHGMAPCPEKGLWMYEMAELGYNYRASDIHCALGLSQLNKLDRFIDRRRTLACLYDELLAPLAPVILPPKRVSDCDPAWHLYAVRIDFEKAGMNRDSLMRALRDKGIGTQVHYIPVHSQPYYEGLYGAQDLPGAMGYYKKTLSLPLYPTLEKEDVERIVASLEKILS